MTADSETVAVPVEEGLVRTMELPGKRVYFFDWRYAHPGSFRWLGGMAGRPGRHRGHRPISFDVTLVPQQAQKSEPLSRRGETWGSILWHGTARHEDGLHRLWCGWMRLVLAQPDTVLRFSVVEKRKPCPAGRETNAPGYGWPGPAVSVSAQPARRSLSSRNVPARSIP